MGEWWEYRSAATESGRGNKTTYSYIVPLAINDRYCWGLLDTGASYTTIPYPVAKEVGLGPDSIAEDGIDTFVGGFPYPFARREYTIHFLRPNDRLADDFWFTLIDPAGGIPDYYDSSPTPAVTLPDVPVRIILKPLSEIATDADWNHSTLELRSEKPLPLAFLGVVGVLDRIEFHSQGAASFSVREID